MGQNAADIHALADALAQFSVSTNADGSSYVTRSDLENFRNAVVEAIKAIANALESD